ncbi:DUF1934 domain-containing protein [Chungangia koreensis]|uniref:DUF1934 domain-containing protein n=1 Tax=Chungangia koreensis TaxID=752657 RepID=A0ABV8X5A3_9LACT
MPQTVEKLVKIKLVTTIRHPDQETETFELWAEGRQVEKAGKTYLTYEEIQEHVTGNIKTTVKFGETEALILRSGGLTMRLPFSMASEQNGSFEGEFGTMLVTTTTLSIDHRDGRFTIEYALKSGSNHVGDYKLEFTYTEGTS